MSRRPEPMKLESRLTQVHHRRVRWHVGTPDERMVGPNEYLTLCGRFIKLLPVADDKPVTCGTCLQAANTGAHLLTVEAVDE